MLRVKITTKSARANSRSSRPGPVRSRGSVKVDNSTSGLNKTHRQTGGIQDRCKGVARDRLDFASPLLLQQSKQRLCTQVQQLAGGGTWSRRSLGQQHEHCHVGGVSIVGVLQAALGDVGGDGELRRGGAAGDVKEWHLWISTGFL